MTLENSTQIGPNMDQKGLKIDLKGLKIVFLDQKHFPDKKIPEQDSSGARPWRSGRWPCCTPLRTRSPVSKALPRTRTNVQRQKYSETLRHSVKGIGIIGVINIMQIFGVIGAIIIRQIIGIIGAIIIRQIIGIIGAIIIRQIIVPFWGRCGQAQRRIWGQRRVCTGKRNTLNTTKFTFLHWSSYYFAH